MKTVLHTAESRGQTRVGWLDSRHSFSFAGYDDPRRTNFGVLRVLNDDIVDGGAGFGEHPHDNMEIISIPLSGELAHRDSMGNQSVIRANDVQIMSAGTGIYHAEFNNQPERRVNFLQIWLYPKERNIAPRYDQRTFVPEDRKNRFQEIVSPTAGGPGVWINQDATFYRAALAEGIRTKLEPAGRNQGMYVFVIDGRVSVAGTTLNKRDGLGVWDTDAVLFEALTDADVLVMDIPLKN